MNQNRVPMEKNTVEQQAGNAYRAEDGWEFGENDGRGVGKDGDESVFTEEDRRRRSSRLVEVGH